MTRKEFLERSLTMGIGLPFLTGWLTSCADDVNASQSFEVNFTGRVLVIGAGAAGMVAGHLLKQHGIDFQIIEALPRFGGRVRKDESLADFPIDLGAEWLHTDPDIFAQLLNDETTNGNIELITYSPETMYVWKNGELRKRNFYTNFYSEYKFKRSTWYDFFDQHIVPGIADNMVFNSPVAEVNYSGNEVVVQTQSGATYRGDRVIVTVPLTVLKQQSITFTPAMPASKFEALDTVDMPDGVKVFMRFTERFYPDITFEGGIFKNLSDSSGEKIYYDAAFRKDTNANVLGLFTVGAPATVYATQPNEEALTRYILDELDEMFDGQARQYYQSHVIQNWSKEPYIQGSYSHYNTYNMRDELAAPINNRVYFAGETYAPEDDIATVHGAGLSAFATVEQLLKTP